MYACMLFIKSIIVFYFTKVGLGTSAQCDELPTRTTTSADETKAAETELGIGTWNVNTLSYTGALALAIRELERYRWDIVGLCETRWSGKGEFYHDQYHVLTSGREDTKLLYGVAMILSKKASQAMIGYKLISERLMYAKFHTAFGKMTVIQVYAPTSTAKAKTINAFYAVLQQVISKIPKDEIIVIVGDLNASVGDLNKNVGTDFDNLRGTFGEFGFKKSNPRGKKLLKFCAKYDLLVMNTFFKQEKLHRKWTWTAPYELHYLIDYVIAVIF